MKYEMVKYDSKYYQIKALKSFGNVTKGDLGGFIASESNLSQEGNAWVSGNACVFGNAWVSNNAWVSGNARVSGNAWVSNNARVSGNACVFGNACVSGNARVSGNACVFGNACVSGNAWVFGDVYLCKPQTSIKRSDGYEFNYFREGSGRKVIIAGCRYFTMKEALIHWEKTRGGTPLGEETMLILKFFKEMEKINEN